MRKTVSFCIIGKDEELSIGKCLDSIKSVANEIVFVDTGSTDKTKEIVSKYTSKIFDRPWDGKFSPPRNLAIDNATSDFIFTIDCDEWLTDAGKEELNDILNKKEIGMYNTSIKNYLDSGDSVVSYNFRLFPRDAALRYRGNIHENVADVEKKYKLLGSTLELGHDGYLKANKTRKNSDNRNYKMLQDAHDAEPDNPYYTYHLGQQAFLAKEYDNAYKYYGDVVAKLTSNPKSEYAPYLPLAYDGMAVVACMQNDLDKINSLKGVITYAPSFYINLGVFFEQANMLNEAIGMFEKAVECTKVSGKLLSFDTGSMTWKPYYSLGNAYYKAGAAARAIDNYRLAIDENPKLYNVMAIISRIYAQIGNPPKAEKYIAMALQGEDTPSNRLHLANLMISGGNVKAGMNLYIKYGSPEQLLNLKHELRQLGHNDASKEVEDYIVNREMYHTFVRPEITATNDVTVIIPTLLRTPPRWFEYTLAELEKSKLVKTIIVIDNTPAKEFKTKIKYGSKVKIVDDQPDMKVNKAWNYGVKMADTKYYLLLNDDILCHESVIEDCYLTLEQVPTYGLMHIATLREGFEEYIMKTPGRTRDIIVSSVPLNAVEGGWFLFGIRENWKDIPADIEVFFGDNWIYEHTVLTSKKKIGKMLSNFISHATSLTVTSLHLYEEGMLEIERKKYAQVKGRPK